MNVSELIAIDTQTHAEVSCWKLLELRPRVELRCWRDAFACIHGRLV